MELVIPQQLVYEEMDGVPIPYKNFHKVLLSTATPEEIVGSSVSQTIVVTAILRYLFRHLNEKKYWLATNEAGFHLSRGNNLSADIALFDRSTSPMDPKNFNYATFPPLVVIEVDIRADLSEFASPTDYYRKKSRKLKEFGVSRVMWVNTGSETVMFDEQLTTHPWDDAFPLTPDLSLSIGRCVRDYLRAE
jgi:Uma2 family endonuclease